MPDSIFAGAASLPFQYGGFVNKANAHACMHAHFNRRGTHLIGVNISERKSGTERTKKRKKRELVFFLTTRGCNWYCSKSSRLYTDFARATLTRDIFNPGPTRPGLSQNWQNTDHFTILHNELALPNTGSWLPSRLSST